MPRAPHLRATFTAISPLSPARGHDDEAIDERDAEVEVDGSRASKKLSDIGIVQRLDAKRRAARRQAADRELAPRAFSVKLPTIAPLAALKATTCAPKSGWPSFVTRPEMLPSCGEVRRRDTDRRCRRCRRLSACVRRCCRR